MVSVSDLGPEGQEYCGPLLLGVGNTQANKLSHVQYCRLDSDGHNLESDGI